MDTCDNTAGVQQAFPGRNSTAVFRWRMNDIRSWKPHQNLHQCGSKTIDQSCWQRKDPFHKIPFVTYCTWFAPPPKCWNCKQEDLLNQNACSHNLNFGILEFAQENQSHKGFLTGRLGVKKWLRLSRNKTKHQTISQSIISVYLNSENIHFILSLGHWNFACNDTTKK